MKIFGIHFAPLFIPFHRRLETLAAFAVLFLLTAFLFLSVFIAIALLFTRLWWLIVIYFIWILLDRKTAERGGRPIEWMQSWRLYEYARNYYPVSVTAVPGFKVDPKKNYMACSFPHGLFPTGAFLGFTRCSPERQKMFPHHQIHAITININFYVPFYREFMLALGFCNAKRESIEHILKLPGGGHITAIMVGGAAESQYAFGGKYHLVLKNRKGFIKLALQCGTPLMPLFSFGETALFKQLVFPEGSAVRKFQNWVRKVTGIAPTIVYGRGFFQYNCGLLPFRNHINVVVGNPIEVEKKENPTQEDIDTLHAKFIEALTNLFEEYKFKFEKEPEKATLVFI